MLKEHFSYFTTPNRIDYQPLFRKMSPLSGSKNRPGRWQKSSHYLRRKITEILYLHVAWFSFPLFIFSLTKVSQASQCGKQYYIIMLQVKIEFRLKFFDLGFSTSFVSWPTFMNDQGQDTKKIENQPRLENLHLNLILTCNVYNNNNNNNNIIIIIMIIIIIIIIIFIVLVLT